MSDTGSFCNPYRNILLTGLIHHLMPSRFQARDSSTNSLDFATVNHVNRSKNQLTTQREYLSWVISLTQRTNVEISRFNKIHPLTQLN
ncbi:hypothetical protein PBPRA0822 [Photobacterium profundum SS9]|uniref:Uncharacterized protein n=1 Tax=Photobacterium profundum (strain SS9) TaxID=298386 RepID=Q6LTZ0_PHOPR|nr:hypothetical protein PBPRA0822 [Photobacterium profundum SS9]